MTTKTMDEYTVRFGLTFDPFLKNSREVFVDNEGVQEALVRLRQLSSTLGFGVLTAPAGTGKTTVVRKWAQSLNPSLYNVIYSPLATVSVNDFYRKLATDLNLQPAFRKTDNFSNIQAEIIRLTRDCRRTPVFIFDEANLLKGDILTDLQILFNFDMDSKDREVVLLVGLPALNGALNSIKHVALRQRLILSCTLNPLNKEQGRAYIQKKLEGADCHKEIFDGPALEAILNTANGTPRLINRLCHKCLLIADANRRNSVTADIVLDAETETSLD